MSSRHRASALALLTLLSYGSAAAAQKIELAGRVSGAPLSGQYIHALGDARFVAVSKLSYDGDRAYVELVDVTTPSVIEVVTTRAVLEVFGRRDPGAHRGIYPPRGELVFLDPAKAGLFLYDDFGQTTSRRHWYVEIARSTGALLRSTNLGAFDGDDDLHYIGTDRIQDRAWFWIERYDTPPPGAHARTRGPKQLTLRRIDLQTHAIWDEMSIALPARPIVTSGHFEAKVDVFASDDLSRFAVVEYSESLFHPTPRASVYVMEPRTSTSFSVPAPETAYSCAFSRDGKALYLASAGGSTVTSVDLVAKRILKTVATPSLPRGLAISPSGSTLFVLGWPESYAVYDLPSLSNRKDLAHDPQVKAAATKYFGNGAVTRDGTHLVFRERTPLSTTWTVGVDPPTPFVVARIVDP